MRDLYSKTNAPYLIAGALATLVLLASGTLAVAPYVKFLSSVAAFNVALPVALSLSILSVLVLVLSCKMISQNKKLDAQKAEPNEKNGLAKEQENIIQSLELQIKELNKRLSSQYNEIVKLMGSAAKKDEVEELISSFTAKLDEISKQANNAATKGEMEELSKKLSDEMEKLIGSLVTKEGIDKLVAREEELHLKISCLREQLQEKEERITELKGKIDNNQCKELENKKLNEEVEKLRKEIRELYEKEDKFYKERDILYEEEKKLHTKLDDLKCEIRKINKEKENLSKKLEKKFDELDEANGLIENQSFELDGIRKDYNNEVKGLKNLLLERDSQIEQLEEDLLRNAEEKKGYLPEMLESVVDKVEKLVNNNEAIGDRSRKIILQETQKIKFILKEIMQFTLGEDSRCESPSEETFDCLLEDLGYASHSSTPIKLPNSLLTESYERNQSESICKTQQ